MPSVKEFAGRPRPGRTGPPWAAAPVWRGNRAMMEERGVDLGGFAQQADELAAQGKTPLYFADDGRLLGIMAVADTAKPTSAAAVAAFRQLGLNVVMLTGDNRRTADAIGKELGVTQVMAEVLPQDKERKVKQLQEQGQKVAMVGDGINDAPALARADVGIGHRRGHRRGHRVARTSC